MLVAPLTLIPGVKATQVAFQAGYRTKGRDSRHMRINLHVVHGQVNRIELHQPWRLDGCMPFIHEQGSALHLPAMKLRELPVAVAADSFPPDAASTPEYSWYMQPT